MLLTSLTKEEASEDRGEISAAQSPLSSWKYLKTYNKIEMFDDWQPAKPEEGPETFRWTLGIFIKPVVHSVG